MINYDNINILNQESHKHVVWKAKYINSMTYSKFEKK